MSKYYGEIGYAETPEVEVGIYEEQIVERFYYGDVMKHQIRNESGESLNDNLTVFDDISILADDYAYRNCHMIRYATLMGVRWKVTSIRPERPRLILSLGGVYNGPTPETPDEPPVDPGDQESLLPTPGESGDGV